MLVPFEVFWLQLTQYYLKIACQHFVNYVVPLALFLVCAKNHFGT